MPIFFACKSENSTGIDTDIKETEEATSLDVETAKKYVLTPFSPSTAFSDAAITDMKYAGGKFDFEVGGGDYELGVQTPDAPQKMCANSDKGQHIHLIVNNMPYVAKYEANFDYDMPDGDQYILAFLSRSYHESIKTDAAYRAVKASVKDKSFAEVNDIEDPMLFYSRPKGTYVGDDTKKVMLDFYLVNANLEDYQVEANVNGEKYIIDSWQPYYLEGLPMGENKIQLTLQDKDGNVVDTPLNPVTRSFELEADPVKN